MLLELKEGRIMSSFCHISLKPSVVLLGKRNKGYMSARQTKNTNIFRHRIKFKYLASVINVERILITLTNKKTLELRPRQGTETPAPEPEESTCLWFIRLSFQLWLKVQR